jgi:hypothetical protein
MFTGNLRDLKMFCGGDTSRAWNIYNVCSRSKVERVLSLRFFASKEKGEDAGYNQRVAKTKESATNASNES